MKKLLLLSALIGIAIIAQASHIVGGEIRMTHISGNDYKFEMSLYRDITGIAAPATAMVQAYTRSTVSNVQTFNLSLDSVSIIPPVTVGCGSPILYVEQLQYSSVYNLNPANFNDPAGYLLVWESCCRNAGVANLNGSSGFGTSIVSIVPPIMLNGVPFVNSSPKLSSPMSDFAINQHPYSLDFGGVDPDGDSLAYSLYTPFNNGQITLGSVTPITAPHRDPTTQFSPVQWAPGYSDTSVISGLGGNHNALSINPVTGELTMIPDVPAPAYYVYGIWCREYRNGQLIGSIFRDFQISVMDYTVNPNTAPQVHVPQLQNLANWNADTMVFSGSPVCVRLGVTDPDSIADIEIEAVYSDYDPDDLDFLQNYAVILNPDTFITSLCFQPDSFLPYTTRGDVVALNPGCFDLRGDTLPFYFKFVGYSNAGWGGNVVIPIGSAQAQPVDLFTLLNYNPNPGGTWYDLDNSGLLGTGNIFYANQVYTTATYRFMYIDQQPNYPPDTAMLTLNFVIPAEIEESLSSEYKIYPNPSAGIFNVDAPVNSTGTLLEVFDITGELIYESEILPGLNSINLAELQDGLYFYRVGLKKGKLLIQRN